MLDNELHFLLLRCFHYSQKMIVQQTSQINLFPGQPKILECLYEKDGQTPKEIGQKCVLDKSTMTSLIQKMEKQDLIYKQSHLSDKRSIQIFLTTKGKQKAQEVKDICHKVDELALSHLSFKQQHEIIQCLQQILSNFEESYDE